MQAPIVIPIDPSNCCVFDVVNVLKGPSVERISSPDGLGFKQSDRRLGQGIEAPIFVKQQFQGL